MEKLKEIFHKLKNTEINLKDLKISSLKEKLSSIKVSADEKTEKEEFSIKNLKNLKNISWQDVKSFDYKNFYLRNKQQILTVFVALMVVFFLFYWTNVFLDSKLSSSLSKAENTYKKLENGNGQRGSGFVFSGEFAKLVDFISYQENPNEVTQNKLDSEWFPYKVKLLSLPVTNDELLTIKNAAVALDDGDEEQGSFRCAEWSSKL